MTVISNVILIDPDNQTEKLGWLRIDQGIIAEVGTGAGPQEALDGQGKCLAPGIVDIGVKVNEPGERHKESYFSAGQAAAKGGVTTIVTRPDTLQAIDTPETLEFVQKRAAEDAIVNVLHMSALTKARNGREMVEIGFMKEAGAVAFSDADNVIESTKIASRCYTYAKSLDALIIGHVQDPGLSHGASLTSGKFASLKGLPSVSPMAERIGLDRELALIEMTGARYHADQITTSRSLPRLSRAKSQGLDITAGVSIHHLTLNEFDIGDYRTFFKVKPPLRSEDDRLAMAMAVADGTIDIISSMHTPQDEESKRLPFEEAASGAVALETLLSASMRLYHAGILSLSQLFRAMSYNPARRLGLDCGRLAKGAPADLVLFDPDTPFVLDRMALSSLSKNTPFDGQRMQGRVIQTWIAGTPVLERES